MGYSSTRSVWLRTQAGDRLRSLEDGVAAASTATNVRALKKKVLGALYYDHSIIYPQTATLL